MAAARAHMNPAVSPEQYRLAQAVLSGSARTGHMSVEAAREIVDRTPKKLRSEYSKFTQNPFYGVDLDLETEMAPAWKYYDSKAARDAHARLKEGEGKKVVLGHSMFGFKEGGGKKWRMRLADHRGNPSKRFIVEPSSAKPGYVSVVDTERMTVTQGGPYKTLGAAKAIAKKLNERDARIKQNPQSSSDDMYASFHGEDPDEVVEYREEEHYHSHVAALGELVELKVKLVNGGRAVISFEDSGEEEVENPKKKKGSSQYKAPGSGRGFWPFNSFTHTTIYHVGAGKKSGVSRVVEKQAVPKSKVVGDFRGQKIEKQAEGFVVPGIDSSVFFDKKDDAKLFIASMLGGGKLKTNPLVEHYREWRKANPGPFSETGKLIGRGRKALSKPMDDFLGTAGKVGGYLDNKLGRALNPATPGSTGPVYLTSNEEGTQVFIIGGDQSLDLSGLGITGSQADKELVTIGKVTNICYHAHKIFNGKREEFDYEHKFSEDSHGPLPDLLYDRINRQLKLSGGVYKIERPLVGTSPGIED